jgi:hypothetical protein
MLDKVMVHGNDISVKQQRDKVHHGHGDMVSVLKVV